MSTVVYLLCIIVHELGLGHSKGFLLLCRGWEVLMMQDQDHLTQMMILQFLLSAGLQEWRIQDQIGTDVDSH